MRKANEKLPKPQPIIQQVQPKLTREEILKRQLNKVNDKILIGIQNSELSINRTKIPYMNKQWKERNQGEAFEKVIQEKRKLQQKIKQLQKTEKLYKNGEKSREKVDIERVAITDQDKRVLKGLKKKLLQFEQSIQRKNKQIEQQKLRKLRQQQENEKRQKELINQRKKLKIESNLEELKQRNKEREEKFKMQQQNLQKLQQKKKLFEILENDWKQKNCEQEKKKYEIMSNLTKQKKYLDLDSLRQHEKKYEEMMAERKRELMQKRLSSSRKSHNTTFSPQKSKFFTIVMKEQLEAKQEEEKKKKRAKETLMKRFEYAQSIREEHAGRLQNKETNSQNENKEPEVVKKNVGLTKQQIKQIGNINLQQGNKKGRKKQKVQIKEEQRSGGSTISHYRDYLKQIRAKKVESNYYGGFYNSPKGEAEKIMRSEAIRNEDKISRIKLLAQRFDNSSVDLVSKIQGKIQILQMIN